MEPKNTNDIDILSSVIATICDYAVRNGMEHDEMLKSIANAIMNMLKKHIQRLEGGSTA